VAVGEGAADVAGIARLHRRQRAVPDSVQIPAGGRPRRPSNETTKGRETESGAAGDQGRATEEGAPANTEVRVAVVIVRLRLSRLGDDSNRGCVIRAERSRERLRLDEAAMKFL
jgi:hypothetical protein